MPWVRHRRELHRRPLLVRCYRWVRLYFLKTDRHYTRHWDEWQW